MILSVSRRTDIPAFYMPWFMNRLREGYVMVRNPMNYHQVSRVSLSPEVIDCMVFWTKNAMPLTPHLGEIALQYPFYIQYTLNPYGRDLEPGLPPLAQRLASACAIAEQFGSKHVVWRYDPIMLTEQYTADWHIEQFAAMADALKGSAVTACSASSTCMTRCRPISGGWASGSAQTGRWIGLRPLSLPSRARMASGCAPVRRRWICSGMASPTAAAWTGI